MPVILNYKGESAMDIKILFLLGAIALNLPSEPSEQYLIKERFDTIGGFYYREYSILTDNKRINYMTMRRLQIILPEDDTIVYADVYPFMYWFDWNDNGKFEPDEIWIDKEVKGIDVKLYND